MISKIIHVIFFSSVLLYIDSVSYEEVKQEEILNRSRRQLLFPNSTLLQFNFGVGTPTPIKTVNVNFAIQTNFQLPWNRSQIPVDILEANTGYVGLSRRKRDLNRYNDNDESKLAHFYKYVEDLINEFGHNGSSCVLRMLCQLAAEPLEPSSREDLLHEIATYILNPLNDIIEEAEHVSSPYIQAYEAGREQQNCISLYHNCNLSLIDFFSKLQ